MKQINTYIMLTLCCFCFCQNKEILYGFSEIPQALMLNPGSEVKNDWYFGIPLLSHVHINGGSSGVSVYNLFADNDIDFNTKFQNVIDDMDSNDFFSFNQQVEFFSVGFAFGNENGKNQYLSFGFYQELDVISYFPKDFVVLGLEGNQNKVNEVFDFQQISASAELISVLHVGYNKRVNNSFSYGFRGKIYSSLVNINSTKNSGTFVTILGNNSFYDHIFDLNLQVSTSGLASLVEEDSDFEANDLSKRIFLGGNLGFGFDFGFTKKLNDQWAVDASLLDVGFITHNKDVENYVVQGYYNFQGINPLFPILGVGQTANEYWAEIEDDFEELFTPDTTNTKYTTWRPVKFNTSINYAFGKKKKKQCHCIDEESDYLNSTGVQLFAMSRPKQTQTALTLYYYRRLFNGLSTKFTYTLDSYSSNNLGLGISANLGNVNFYVMANNLLQLKNIYDAQSVSLQFGFNYILRKNED